MHELKLDEKAYGQTSVSRLDPIHSRNPKPQGLTLFPPRPFFRLRAQRRSNRRKSRIRSRVEHVFALIKTSLGGLHLRYIGMPRIAATVALTNLLHNVIRFGQLRDLAAAAA